MLAWHLGLRYLRRRRSAWLALAAITLTVTVPVVVVGVTQGFIDITRKQVRANESDLTLEGEWRTGTLTHDPKQQQQINDTPGVQLSSPFIGTYAILSPRSRNDLRLNLPCLVDAIDWSIDQSMGRITPNMLHPRPVTDLHAPPLTPDERGSGFLTPKWRDHLVLTGLDIMNSAGLGLLPLPPRRRPEPGLVIGREIAYSYGLRIGESVSLNVPDGTGGNKGQVTAEISDTIGTGIYEVDRTIGLLPLPMGQRLTDLDERRDRKAGISGYRIQLTPESNLTTVRDVLSNITGQRVTTWMERRGNLVRSFEIQRNIMAIVMIAIQGIAVFVVYAVFSTLVAEKRHDIGVLLGIGARRRDITSAFLIAGIAACVFGGLFGWGLGWGILAVLNPISEFTGFPLFPQEVLYTPDAPISWNPLIPLFFIATMSIIGILAVLIPAIRASRIDPVAILREGA